MKKVSFLVFTLVTSLLMLINVKAAGTYEVEIYNVTNQYHIKTYTCTYGEACLIEPIEQAGYKFMGYRALRIVDGKKQWAKAKNSVSNEFDKWVDAVSNDQYGDKSTNEMPYYYCANGVQKITQTAPAGSTVKFYAYWYRNRGNDYDESDVDNISKKTGLSKGIVSMIADAIYEVFSKACKNGEHIDPPQNYLTNTVEKIVGQDGYCNKDSNGNLKTCEAAGINGKFACIAYSQVGYKEKKTKYKLDSCTANAGSGSWTKYEWNGLLYTNQWDNTFVDWVARMAGADTNKLSHIKATSKYSACSSPKEGDVVHYYKDKNNNSVNYFGILYKDKSGYFHVVHGNWNDQVADTKATKKGAIPMPSGLKSAACLHTNL